MYFDVIIIGAGPAGCTAAIHCRQQGLHTLIITGKPKNSGIENKELQPAESIHPGVMTILSQLNAAPCIDLASQGIYEGIAINDRYDPLGEDETGRWQGHHISRTLFDASLLQVAMEAGANTLNDDVVAGFITTNDRINGLITESGQRITCLYIIDASGHKRIAGKKLGFKESFHSPPLLAWTGVSEISPGPFPFEKNRARFIPHPNGWTWVAPANNNSCTWTRLEIKGQQQFLPPVELKDHSLLSEIKRSNRRWRLFRPVCKEGILLCGDAAGIIDPAAGQGILNALISAGMAVKTVMACMNNPGFEALYLAQYDEWFSNYYHDKVDRLKHFYQLHGIEIFEEK